MNSIPSRRVQIKRNTLRNTDFPQRGLQLAAVFQRFQCHCNPTSDPKLPLCTFGERQLKLHAPQRDMHQTAIARLKTSTDLDMGVRHAQLFVLVVIRLRVLQYHVTRRIRRAVGQANYDALVIFLHGNDFGLESVHFPGTPDMWKAQCLLRRCPGAALSTQGRIVVTLPAHLGATRPACEPIRTFVCSPAARSSRAAPTSGAVCTDGNRAVFQQVDAYICVWRRYPIDRRPCGENVPTCDRAAHRPMHQSATIQPSLGKLGHNFFRRLAVEALVGCARLSRLANGIR